MGVCTLFLSSPILIKKNNNKILKFTLPSIKKKSENFFFILRMAGRNGPCSRTSINQSIVIHDNGNGNYKIKRIKLFLEQRRNITF